MNDDAASVQLLWLNGFVDFWNCDLCDILRKISGSVKGCEVKNFAQLPRCSKPIREMSSERALDCHVSALEGLFLAMAYGTCALWFIAIVGYCSIRRSSLSRINSFLALFLQPNKSATKGVGQRCSCFEA
jgi:hypothetical protein